MTSKTPSTTAIAFLAAFLAACGGGDATEPEEVALDQVAGMQIATTLMSEIITIGFSALAGADAPAGAVRGELRSALSAGGLVPITQTVPCQGGGTINVTGSYTNTLGNAGTGNVAFDLRQVPNNCVMTTSQGAYTVNGNPDFTITGDLSVTAWNLGVFHFTYGGGFRWSGRGGSGSCSIDLTYNFNYATSSVSASGHICGYVINFNQTV
jgi:hypothetical protein